MQKILESCKTDKQNQELNKPTNEEIWIFKALCLYWCGVELHIYPILISGASFLGAKVSGFEFWRFIFGSEGFWFCIWRFIFWSGCFLSGFWKSIRSIGDASAWSEMGGCIVMHGFRRT